MIEYGSTDLQALVQITGEGGPWNNTPLVTLLTEQPTDPDERERSHSSQTRVVICNVQHHRKTLLFVCIVPLVNAYLVFEGEDFLEMRIKQLEKVGELAKALILTKACGNCPSLPSQATFLQTYVTQLCQQLPGEKAILEVSRFRTCGNQTPWEGYQG